MDKCCLQAILKVENVVLPLWHEDLQFAVANLQYAPSDRRRTSKVLSDIAAAAQLQARLSVARTLESQEQKHLQKMRLFMDSNLGKRSDPSGVIKEVCSTMRLLQMYRHAREIK